MRRDLLAFNRGLISPLALARTDFKRLGLSAEVMSNWVPRKLGSMMLRPGMAYLGTTLDNAPAISIPFVASSTDLARLEVTETSVRIWVDDELVTRPEVSTVVTNGSITSAITGWDDADEGAAVSGFASGGYMKLTGTGTSAARRRQQVTVAAADQDVEHCLYIVVARGPVLLRIGSSIGGEEYFEESTLGTGSHSICFTPTGPDFHIQFANYEKRSMLVASCEISTGTVELLSPWASDDLDLLRWDQSIDVIYIAAHGYKQRRIERRSNNSWSLVQHEPTDGPFLPINLTPITLTPAAVSGDTTVTASAPIFRTGHVNSLLRLTQTGQTQTATLSGSDQFTDPIRVVGADERRAFAISITGTWVGTIKLQYSVAEPGDWIDAPSGAWSLNTAQSYDDTLDNQVLYYRLGFKAGDYVSGSATATISWANGTQTGICRINEVTSETVVEVGIIEDFGTVDPTAEWSEATWSNYRGYPSSVQLYEGRLFWGGKDRVQATISDDFTGHDDEYEGDAGPIQRSIGKGPADKIAWMAGAERLLLATASTVWSARSSSLDEPLTALNFNLKARSPQGAALVAPVVVDTSVIFVQRSGSRIYEAAFDGGSFDYGISEVAAHVPEIGEPGILRMAVQHQPETRVHCVRSDGKVAMLVLDKNEDVVCWLEIETDGLIEDVCILPGEIEEQVYYQVKRTINGSTVRYFEKWALESECVGETLNKQLDSYVTGTGTGSTVTGLDHLEGETVRVWADGAYQGEFTVQGGQVECSYTQGYVAGLVYEALYKSTKMVWSLQDGSTSLTLRKRIAGLGVIAQNMHPQALSFGPDFDTMDNLPPTELYDDVDPDAIWAQYDQEPFSFPGDWSTDSRLCLKATAPLPVTLLAAVVSMETQNAL